MCVDVCVGSGYEWVEDGSGDFNFEPARLSSSHQDDGTTGTGTGDGDARLTVAVRGGTALSGYARAWSKQTIGLSNEVTPHFAIRLTQLVPCPTAGASEETPVRVVIGVSARQFEPSSPWIKCAVSDEQYGVTYSVCNIANPPTPDAGDGGDANDPPVWQSDGSRAVWNRRMVSITLIPDPFTADVKLVRGAGWFYNGVTLGVACNLTTNSLSFYIDDSLLVVTQHYPPEDDDGATGKPQKAAKSPPADAFIASGDPFVWQLPRDRISIGDCVVYFASTGIDSLRAQFVDDWTPPPLPLPHQQLSPPQRARSPTPPPLEDDD